MLGKRVQILGALHTQRLTGQECQASIEEIWVVVNSHTLEPTRRALQSGLVSVRGMILGVRSSFGWNNQARCNSSDRL